MRLLKFTMQKWVFNHIWTYFVLDNPAEINMTFVSPEGTFEKGLYKQKNVHPHTSTVLPPIASLYPIIISAPKRRVYKPAQAVVQQAVIALGDNTGHTRYMEPRKEGHLQQDSFQPTSGSESPHCGPAPTWCFLNVPPGGRPTPPQNLALRNQQRQT